ncbi:lysine-specific histone demethylase 1A-like isoform X2 [Ostrinia nubilalis]|uniref:lysine-specific histone demethylase 1A-like isoform X2 n=1 Tax=Ostrinia nubilalis TaxID=29057 RepID=UPI003082563E
MALWRCILAAVFLVGVTTVNSSPTMSSYDTIVVGMGAAGTTAASILAKAGKRVLGLEAQNRVGGRINTVPFGDGVVELGAEWMHGTKPNTVYDLAVQNNVTVLPQDISMEVYMSDGSLANKELVNELTEFCLQVVDEPPPTPQPLGQYITKRLMDYIKDKHPTLLKDQGFINEFLAFMDLMIDNYEATDTWNDITTESKYRVLDGHQHMSWNKNGYKTLFEILLNTYKNGPGLPTLTIKLNTEVSQIVWPQDPSQKVIVKSKDGAEYSADNVIVTVSVGVLKERHTTLFTPRLPSAKVSTINSISLGVVDKIILLFPHSWWPKSNSAFHAFIWKSEEKKKVNDWTTKIFGASSPMGCDTALTLWTNGETSRLVETLPDDVVKRKAMELLRRFMGANVTIPEPISMLRSSWYTNPYTRGSYTYDNLSSPSHPTAREDLAAPLSDSSGRPRVLFAGEATETNHFSTVHGAVGSGEREAARLLPSSKI